MQAQLAVELSKRGITLPKSSTKAQQIAALKGAQQPAAQPAEANLLLTGTDALCPAAICNRWDLC